MTCNSETARQCKCCTFKVLPEPFPVGLCLFGSSTIRLRISSQEFHAPVYTLGETLFEQEQRDVTLQEDWLRVYMAVHFIPLNVRQVNF